MTQDVAIQRCDRFVGRTMNWLYDHLRHLEDHRPVVLTKALENREEFPLVDARIWPAGTVGARAWRWSTGKPFTPAERRWIARLGPKVLHSHFGYVAVDDYPLADLLQVPWCVSFYGADVYLHRHQPERVARYADLFTRVDRVLALGPVMAKALSGMGCPPDKITIHPLGVDIDGVPHREREYAAGAPLRLLFAGTFREKKGLIYLIEAAGHLQRRGVPFTLDIVGAAAGRSTDAEVEAEVRNAVGVQLSTAQVRFHGWLPFRSLMDLALDAHVFVAPSCEADDGDAEGTPFVVQQMMLSGMPVVTTMHSDIPFLFGPHADLLIPERDARAIADRLMSYVDSPDLVYAHGAMFRERMLAAFGVQGSAASLSTIYRSLAP